MKSVFAKRVGLLMSLVAAVGIFAIAGCAAPADRDAIYQVSTLHALLEGVYDGDTTVADLKKHGDLGIGTFNALDGEMAVLDGEVYQIRSDGTVHVMADSVRTPFSGVTFFEVDQTVALPAGTDYPAFKKLLDAKLPTLNLPYAIRIDGEFSYVKARAVPKQSKPYRKLVEVVKHQPEFEMKNVRGTLVGFRLPGYFKGINVPAYHLHFLTDDRAQGGHLQAFTIKSATAKIDTTPRVNLNLPTGQAFGKVKLDDDKAKAIEAVEK